MPEQHEFEKEIEEIRQMLSHTIGAQVDWPYNFQKQKIILRVRIVFINGSESVLPADGHANMMLRHLRLTNFTEWSILELRRRGFEFVVTNFEGVK